MTVSGFPVYAHACEPQTHIAPYTWVILTHTAIQNKKGKERKAAKVSYSSIMPVTLSIWGADAEIYKSEANLGDRLRQSLKEKQSS